MFGFTRQRQQHANETRQASRTSLLFDSTIKWLLPIAQHEKNK